MEKNWERFGWIWGASGPFCVKNRHFRNCLKVRSYYTHIPYLTRILPYWTSQMTVWHIPKFGKSRVSHLAQLSPSCADALTALMPLMRSHLSRSSSSFSSHPECREPLRKTSCVRATRSDNWTGWLSSQGASTQSFCRQVFNLCVCVFVCVRVWVCVMLSWVLAGRDVVFVCVYACDEFGWQVF